jgi:micrococcal nuclease
MFCSCFSANSKYNLDKKAIIPVESNLVWENTIPFVPPITEGIVIKVYDGDTITIASKLPYDASPMYRFSVRLAGIDCAEIKGKTDREKALALQAKNALQTLLLGRAVTLKNVKTEKYGRILADIYLDNLYVNEWLLENKYAEPYFGGTKSHNWV